jgi:hypothetical protein
MIVCNVKDLKRQSGRHRRKISKSVSKTRSCFVSMCERLCYFRETKQNKAKGEEYSLFLSSGIPSKHSGTFDSSFSNRDFQTTLYSFVLHVHITALLRHL